VPDSGFYTTIAMVDFALEFLADARKQQNPWPLYISLSASHAPIHALEEDYRKHRGKHNVGWDVIQQRRVAKQVQLGILDVGKKCAILYTIVENCRRLGINAREYLEDVLTRLPAMKASEAASLTPARWLAARSGKTLRPAA